LPHYLYIGWKSYRPCNPPNLTGPVRPRRLWTRRAPPGVTGRAGGRGVAYLRPFQKYGVEKATCTYFTLCYQIPMISCVYALQHRPTGHVYIGGTTNFHHRWLGWRHAIKRRKVPKRFALLSHDPKDWDIYELERTTAGELRKLEVEYYRVVLWTRPELSLNKHGSPGAGVRSNSSERP
jgi:hypothetical protein